MFLGAPHAHILLWLGDLNEEIEKVVYINGIKTTTIANKPAPNFKNCVQGKEGIEKEEGIRKLQEFADLLISVSSSDEKVLKYQTHNHTFTCHKQKQKNNAWIVVQEHEGFGKDDGKKTGPILKTPKCRFKFPRFPMQKTTFLEKIDSSKTEAIVIQKAKVNLNRIKKYMLRNLFQENKGDYSTEREAFLSLSFDKFLENLGMSEEDYLMALRSGVTGHGFMFMKRTCKEVFINNFNRRIMATHPANNDFTLCIDENQVAQYVINYLTKSEAGQSKMLREVDEQCAKEGLTYSEKLKKFADALDQSREVSVQEIIYRLLGFPMAQFSRKIKYLSTTDSEHRDGILKSNLDELEDGESAFLKSAIEYYEKRPNCLDLLTLADFWSRFEIVYGRRDKVSDEADDDFDNDDDKETKLLRTYQLKDEFGVIRERRNPAVLRYYLDKNDSYEKLRGLLLLFHPFRNEYEEISSKDLRIVWDRVQSNELQREMMNSQIDYYQPYLDLVKDINAYIIDEREDEQDEDYGNDEDENVTADDGMLETTDQKDIAEFIKHMKREKVKETDFISKSLLLENVRKLNRDQRKIWDDIVERLMSGDFKTNQFLLYIR